MSNQTPKNQSDPKNVLDEDPGQPGKQVYSFLYVENKNKDNNT